MKVKAILIDAKAQTVTDVELDNGDINHMHVLLKCDCFTLAGNFKGNIAYVDDEGLYKDNLHYFQWPGYPQPLAGNGLIMGPDNGQGDHVDVTISAAEISPSIEFITHLDRPLYL